MSTIGILCMAYGTAAGPEDVERYYTDIRGGRAPTPEHLAELRARYAAIGNRFPLLEITRAQAAGLERALNAGGGSSRFRTYLGMRHSPPFVAEGVERMRRDGIARAVGLVLAPHWAAMSVDSYVERVEKALADVSGDGPSFTFVRQWFDHPRFLDLLASRVRDALATLVPDRRARATVIFSAHSLPTREVEDGTLRCTLCTAAACEPGCRYVAQLHRTAEMVAERAGGPDLAVGWQSAGRTADPWWGPPVERVIEEQAARGRTAVVSCSAGFVADHLEVLYDLDIEARRVAEGRGLAFVRTEMPNADPAFVEILAAIVRDHLEHGFGTDVR